MMYDLAIALISIVAIIGAWTLTTFAVTIRSRSLWGSQPLVALPKRRRSKEGDVFSEVWV